MQDDKRDEYIGTKYGQGSGSQSRNMAIQKKYVTFKNYKG